MSRAELCRTLAAMVATHGPATPRHTEALGLDRAPTAAEHTETFTFQLHPYASVHLGAEGKLGGEARDRIAGFFRALEITPPPEPDHLAVLLDAHAQLIDLDADRGRSRARHARTVLLHEHLACWVGRFTARVAELTPAPYARWARLLDELLAAETDLLGVAPALPSALREAPDLTGLVDDGRHAFVDGLLAPARSGLVIARADLARAAADLDLGLRIGERAYTLTALLQQDTRATLRWTAHEARRQRDALPLAPDPTTTFWHDRLAATAALLDDLVAAHGMPVAG